MTSRHEDWIEEHCIEHYERRPPEDLTEEQLIDAITSPDGHDKLFFRDRSQETILVSDVREYLEKLDKEFRDNRLRLVHSRE